MATAKLKSNAAVPQTSIAEICTELRNTQRNRVAALKSRIMLENRAAAFVAVYMGYSAGDDASDREHMLAMARAHADKIRSGEVKDEVLEDMIKTADLSIKGFRQMVEKFEDAMLQLVKQLPVAQEWINHPDRRGFGLHSLAIVIGEAGDLSNYANPGKLWRRMACAPFESKGRNLMGSTWKSGREGKLSTEEWEKFGYSPRRRSVMYLIGEGLMKLNGAVPAKEDRPAKPCGPYRERYDQAKALTKKTHPEWWATCKACKGKAKKKGCEACKGSGITSYRAHLHGMLLASKRLLRDLWCEWNGEDPNFKFTLRRETNGSVKSNGQTK